MISIFEIYESLRDKILVLILAMLVGFFSAIIYISVADIKYRANILMVPVHDEDSRSSTQSMISQLGGLTGMSDFGSSENSMTTQSYLALLHSREFLYKFIQENNVRTVLFPDLYDDSKDLWLTEPPSYEKTHRYLVNSVINFTFDKKTNLVYFYVTLGNADLAAEWANNLIFELNKYSRDTDIKQAEMSKKFLLSEVERTSLVNPQNMLNDLIEKQIKTIMLANVKEGYVFRVLDKAYPPESQVWPRPLLTVLLSTMISFFMAVLFIVVLANTKKLK